MNRHRAWFRFRGALNDFLAVARRDTWFERIFQGTPGVRDAIQALGVPHPEIGAILIDGTPVGFAARVADGARVEVFADAAAAGPAALPELRPPLTGVPRFVLDVHLGKLARFLRLLGFDTAWRNDLDDPAIAAIAAREGRVVLTRDVGLLKLARVAHGRWVRATVPTVQVREILGCYRLAGKELPFTRCLICNTPVVPVAEADIAGRLPPRVKGRYQELSICTMCDRVFWKGTHFQRMSAGIAGLLQELRVRPPG